MRRGLSAAAIVVWVAPCALVVVSMVHAMGRTHPALLAGVAVGCAGLVALLLRRKRPPTDQ
ncbi:MAG: hypothetical protein ACYTGN_10130 [Planctomycetota bacterium]|jgi:hypothetical protein